MAVENKPGGVKSLNSQFVSRGTVWSVNTASS